ncbi:MAG TPA: ABC transporter permease [Gemmatimonadales bacterium]|nr:ABC transporter permease [Gemmatimonadales bacterium]
MLTTLAFRHLLVRKVRSLFLLLGFSIGVGVMIVLLSVGEAMLEQSRDVSLVGGGEITVLPLGIDVEAMRTGGIGGLFFGIDRARFVTRQALGGPRHGDLIRAVSPVIEGKLLYLRRGDRLVPVRAGGEIPSRAAAVGSGLDVVSGEWKDSGADSAYFAPTPQQLYDQLDRFHLPASPDSTWGEWHYFNIVVSPHEWWYITYLIGGLVGVKDSAPGSGRWGGQLLVTHRRPDGRYERFLSNERASSIQFDTSRADIRIGGSSVQQRDGKYRLRGTANGNAGAARIEVDLIPAPNRYFPPVELRDDEFLSGYVVPGLVASASGRICVARRCRDFSEVPAYHDHNWGVWRNVTWEWGAAQGRRLAILYGGVYGPERATANTAIRSPFFLAAVDSLGVKQVLRFDRIEYQGSRSAKGTGSFDSPRQFDLQAVRERDTLRLHVVVEDALGTELESNGFRRGFLQMRGRFTLSARLLGQSIADSGKGFFETYVTPR